MLPGCHGTVYSDELTLIDSLLSVDPDSAWQRLSEYDTLRLQSENDRHYYALLSAEANDKTYHVDTSDRAISDAAAYFIDKGDREKAMRSLFYKGIVYQNAGKYGPAIITQLKSLEMADTANHLYRGKICNAISEIYKGVSDAPQELEYAQMSLEEYEKLDSLVFIEDMKLTYGYALCRNNRIDEGIEQMQEVYKAAMERSDEERIETALIYMALGYLWANDSEKAKDCFTFLYSTEDKFSQFDVYLYLYLNAMISARAPSDSITRMANSIINYGLRQELPFRYYANNNNYQKAYEMLLEECHQNDSLYVNRIRSTVSQEVNFYMGIEQNKANLKIRELNGIINWIIVSVILLICLILTLVRVYSVSKKKKEKELLYSMEILKNEKSGIIHRFNELSSYNDALVIENEMITKRADELRVTTENLNKEKSEMISRVDKLSADNKHLLEENNALKNEQITKVSTNQGKGIKDFESDLISKLFGELDLLHTQYYIYGNTEKGKTIILNQLSGQLTFLREDQKVLTNMEYYINSISNDLIAEVYEHTKLNGQQRRIVALLCMGFSKQAVCLIMDIEMSSFYTRMNRLTKRIGSCESPRKDELLALMGRVKG